VPKITENPCTVLGYQLFLGIYVDVEEYNVLG
jgi:hypothetical protein